MGTHLDVFFSSVTGNIVLLASAHSLLSLIWWQKKPIMMPKRNKIEERKEKENAESYTLFLLFFNLFTE